MKTRHFHSHIKRSGLLIVFVAVVRSATIATFFTNWHDEIHDFYDKDASDVWHEFPVSQFSEALCLGNVESEIVYARSLGHYDGMADARVTLAIVVFGYILYLIGRFSDGSAPQYGVDRTWCLIALLVFVLLFANKDLSLGVSCYGSVESRCRNISSPSIASPVMESIINAFVEREALRCRR